jgi:GT2 family glycosyltransferase
MIATHNRREDLARTIGELRKLNPPPHEILVCADGCTDDTEEFVRETIPSVQLLVNTYSRGSVKSRNMLMRKASSDIVLSLDDDSYPVEPDFLEKVTALFAADPELAVVTFPQRSDEFLESLTQENFGPALNLGTYTSSGSAIRRDLFLRLGGYMSMFYHAYEEPDYAVRCVNVGRTVRFEPSLSVRHHFTRVGRNEIRTHHFHARNEFWSLVMRCPMPQLFAVAAFRWVRQLGYAIRRGPRWVVNEPEWWFRALAGIGSPIAERHPIPWARYRKWMRLVHKPENAP